MTRIKEHPSYMLTTCISSKHGDNVCKVLKISVLNCKRSFENIGLKLYEELVFIPPLFCVLLCKPSSCDIQLYLQKLQKKNRKSYYNEMFVHRHHMLKLHCYVSPPPVIFSCIYKNFKRKTESHTTMKCLCTDSTCSNCIDHNIVTCTSTLNINLLQ